MNESHFTGHNMLLNPPAIVVQAFDEQQAKREWDEACADEQDATERKAAILQAALKRWPMVPRPGFPGHMNYHPEMRRFVRDVLGMPDQNGGMNAHASRLAKRGAEGWREKVKDITKRVSAASAIRRAVKELTSKYRNGADPAECMEALAKFYEEQTRG